MVQRVIGCGRVTIRAESAFGGHLGRIQPGRPAERGADLVRIGCRVSVVSVTVPLINLPMVKGSETLPSSAGFPHPTERGAGMEMGRPVWFGVIGLERAIVDLLAASEAAGRDQTNRPDRPAPARPDRLAALRKSWCEDGACQ